MTRFDFLSETMIFEFFKNLTIFNSLRIRQTIIYRKIMY